MNFHVKLRGWTQIWKSPLGGYIAPSFSEVHFYHVLFFLLSTSFVSLPFFFAGVSALPFFCMVFAYLVSLVSESNLPPNLSYRRLTGRHIQTPPELRRELRKLPAQAQHFGLGASGLAWNGVANQWDR